MRSSNSPNIETHVEHEQICTLYRQSSLVLFANLVNAVIITIVLWNEVEQPRLLSWLGAMLVMVFARLQLRRGYWASGPSSRRASKWARAAVVGSLASGLLWGAGGALFLSGRSLASQLIVPFVLGGMGAAAAGTLACYLPAFIAFFLPAMLPPIAKLVLVGGSVHYWMTAMAALYVGLMTGVARNVNRAIAESLRLRFANEALAGELGEAERRLLRNNADLEQRVAERTAEIERNAEERARLERALRAARHLEAIGRLAGGVAHDFNNALSVVLAGTEALREHSGAAAADDILDDIERSARSAAGTAQKLLAFSRRRPDEGGECKPAEVMQLFAASVRRMLPETIELVVDASHDAWIGLPAGQLDRVLLNLVLNARDAMPRGGKIMLRSRAEGDRVSVDVTDDGLGMDEQTKARLFEPYFTTKGDQGTGLGLAMVWGLVTSVGGEIEVESQAGHGASFRMRFAVVSPRTAPTSAPAADGIAETAQLDPVPTDASRILVLEDEGGVRRAIERILRTAGYDVSSHEIAASAHAALAASRFDCLMTDSVVPGGGVSDLIKAFVAANPGAPVLVCSGHVGEQAVLDGINRDSYRFVAKPFAPKALLAVVARALAKTSPSGCGARAPLP